VVKSQQIAKGRQAVDKHSFVLAAFAVKAPEVDQLLLIWNAADDMSHQRAKDAVCDLAMACCRLQQELAGAQALRNPQCAKCGGSGHLRRSWNNDYVDCDACDGRGN